ncbi:MAG: hypothetical protein ACRDFW_10060, partial [bacterium]
MGFRKCLGLAVGVVVLVLGGGLAQADTVPVSAACQSGVGADPATCFRPSVQIGSDPTGNANPLFVEVTAPAGDEQTGSIDAVISMQANLVGEEFITLVLMNLDSSVDPADLSITFHAADGGTAAPTITVLQDGAGEKGLFGFDIS